MANINKFYIESLDPLSQGVSKTDKEILFIAKTLVGEEGSCEIFAGKKNISFAKIKTLEVKSPERITPECRHYSNCGGCQLLHTSYENELKIKKSAVIDLFKRMHKLDIENLLSQIPAPQRLHYRNRVQLHYDKKANTIGFLSEDNKSIINVPDCKIANEAITEEIKKVYISSILGETSTPKGHVEIYQKDGKIQKTWNSRYSNEGFSQVYDQMNERLLSEIKKYTDMMDLSNSTVIDLFGGNGNLTKHLSNKTLVVDSTPMKFITLRNNNQEYININLYHHTAAKEFQKTLSNEADIQLLMIDPPRSGLKNLDEFCQGYNGKHIIYVSCNAQTLARDINKISDKFKIEKIIQLDFFPGTKHFETMAILRNIHN